MIDKIFDAFCETFRSNSLRPRNVLEIGALPNSTALLHASELRSAELRLGINYREQGTYNGFTVLQGDGRELPFKDASFDLVLSNAVLEHVPEFWKVCEEMKRVLVPEGHMIVGVPGFTETRLGGRIKDRAKRIRLPEMFTRATITFRVHDTQDFYRFSDQAVRDVIFKDMENVRVWNMMSVPRIFGIGQKRFAHTCPSE